MRVLVTGATGFLGTPLVHRLLTEGVTVRVLVRSLERAQPLREQGAEVVQGEITDRDAVYAATNDVRVVYHLAGRLLVAGTGESVYHRVHVEGTRLLLAAATRVGVERFVHCSTTGVLGVTGDQAADEAAPFRPTTIYESTKAEAERLVRGAWEQGFPAVIVRPGLVYGPGDLHLLGFFQAIRRGYFRPIGRRPVWFHPIYIDDMIEALLRCGRYSQASGQCFHIAGSKPVTIRELAVSIARAEGVAPPRGFIPDWVARILATVGDLLPAQIKPLAPLTSDRLNFLTNSRIYDISKAQSLLGFIAATDLQVGIARTVDWYRHHGYLPVSSSPVTEVMVES